MSNNKWRRRRRRKRRLSRKRSVGCCCCYLSVRERNGKKRREEGKNQSEFDLYVISVSVFRCVLRDESVCVFVCLCVIVMEGKKRGKIRKKKDQKKFRAGQSVKYKKITPHGKYQKKRGTDNDRDNNPHTHKHKHKHCSRHKQKRNTERLFCMITKHTQRGGGG